MAQTLFRQEAIDHHRAKIWSEVTLAVPVPLTVMTGFLAFCLVAIAVFVSFASYARKEHVTGFLAARLGVAQIRPPRAGTIIAVHVIEGQTVKAGAPLVTINVEQTNQNGSGVDTAVIESLKQQRQRLKDEIALDRQKSADDGHQLDQEIAGLTNDLTTMTADLELQAQRTKVAHDQLAAIVGLTKRGLVTQVEFRRREDNYIQQQQAELAARRSISDKEKELSLKREARAQLPLALEKQVTQIEASIADLTARIQATEGQRAYIINAPKAGRISALQAWTGAVADPTVPLMTVVPEGDRLTAELFASPRAIGLIARGQTVHLNYASFPAQQFGYALGKVETISYTLLKPDQSAGPINLAAAAYRVSVSLDRQSINVHGKEIALQPDMQLEADILVDRHRLASWIFGSILSPWRQSP